jgi:hypothetical protein
MAMLCHLAGFAGLVGIPFGNILGPLVVWLVKKQESPYVDHHGREALNFQISATIYALICFALVFVVIGLLLLPALAIFWLVVMVIAAIRASEGVIYRYPMTLRML